MTKTYSVRRCRDLPVGEIDFSGAEEGRLTSVREESSDHHPGVSFRLLHSERTLFVAFRVADRYVRSVQTELHSSVCTDSCVEFFVRPGSVKGYFNVEINAGGTLHLSFVEDPRRRPDGSLTKCTLLPSELCGKIEILSSLPRVVDPECVTPLDWSLRYALPLSTFEPFVGPVTFGKGWRANFYKCGDRTSHPHWISWSPVPALNFHAPESFGELSFE